MSSILFHSANGSSQWRQLSYLLNDIYTDDLNHLLRETGVGLCVGGTWVNIPSYADDKVLPVPTFTALQTNLDVCHSYAGLHDIIYNTSKAVRMVNLPRQSQRLYATGVRLGNDELG